MTQDSNHTVAAPDPVDHHADEPVESTVLVARGAAYYRRTRYVLAILLVAAGMYFGYDGFYGYPAKNARIAQITKQIEDASKAGQDSNQLKELGISRSELGKTHDELDMTIQKLLFFVLPIAGIGLLAWTLRNSRGEYRMEANTLRPSEGTIGMDRIVSIDNTRWDRKGIAWVTYKKTDNSEGMFLLDDFVYDALPIRGIHKRLMAHLHPEPEETEESSITDIGMTPGDQSIA